MTLTIVLQDENGVAIEILGSDLTIKSDIGLNNFKLLQYLDAYGDTIFNRNQVDDLVSDLEKLNALATSTIISQIISLAKRCKDELHTYLCFCGD